MNIIEMNSAPKATQVSLMIASGVSGAMKGESISVSRWNSMTFQMAATATPNENDSMAMSPGLSLANPGILPRAMYAMMMPNDPSSTPIMNSESAVRMLLSPFSREDPRERYITTTTKKIRSGGTWMKSLSYLMMARSMMMTGTEMMISLYSSRPIPAMRTITVRIRSP